MLIQSRTDTVTFFLELEATGVNPLKSLNLTPTFQLNLWPLISWAATWFLEGLHIWWCDVGVYSSIFNSQGARNIHCTEDLHSLLCANGLMWASRNQLRWCTSQTHHGFASHVNQYSSYNASGVFKSEHGRPIKEENWSWNFSRGHFSMRLVSS